MNENISKGKLLKRLNNLYKDQQSLFHRAVFLKKEHRKFENQNQLKIKQLRIEANDLANQFRSLYRESQTAYNSDEKELAFNLSVKGHAVQNQCEFLNDQISILSSEFKRLYNQKEETFRKLKDTKYQITKLKSLLRNLRSTKTKGFNRCQEMRILNIEEFLDQFPQRVFEEIKKIEFQDSFKINNLEAKEGITHFDNKTGEASIMVYSHLFSSEDKIERRNKLKATISHEIGHVIFRRLLSQGERGQWRLFAQESIIENKFVTEVAQLSGEEDFCESFMIFKIKIEKLKDNFPKRLKFLREMYSNLQKIDV